MTGPSSEAADGAAADRAGTSRSSDTEQPGTDYSMPPENLDVAPTQTDPSDVPPAQPTSAPEAGPQPATPRHVPPAAPEDPWPEADPPANPAPAPPPTQHVPPPVAVRPGPPRVGVPAPPPATTPPAQPFTPEQVCGPGFHVIDRAPLPGATVYLLWRSSSLENCVVTLKSKDIGDGTSVTAYLQADGHDRSTDHGTYKYYAGPVRQRAPGCIRWGGSYDGHTYESPAGQHCRS